MSASAHSSSRSRAFRTRDHDRYWWHRLADTDYVPAVYAALSDEEWQLMESWFDETESLRLAGEINVPAMCLLYGIVSGGAVRRMVQLGHFSGYSTLLLGFVLRQMGASGRLVSIDIDADVTIFTQRWLAAASLEEYVSLVVGDSADPASIDSAIRTLGGPPQLILVDSSHAYGQTLRELDAWTAEMPVGALMVLHDSSLLGRAWDATGDGGVRRALDEWLPGHDEMAGLNLNAFVQAGDDANALVYKDGCGLALLQKAGPPQDVVSAQL